MKYIKPIMTIESIEAEQMMALSLKEGTADNSEVLVNEEQASEASNDVWTKEW